MFKNFAPMDLGAAVRALAAEGSNRSRTEGGDRSRTDFLKRKQLAELVGSVPDPYRKSFLRAVVSSGAASSSSHPDAQQRNRTIGFSFGSLRKMTDAAFLVIIKQCFTVATGF